MCISNHHLTGECGSSRRLYYYNGGLIYFIYLLLKKRLDGRRIKDAKTLSVIGTLVIIPVLATLLYAWQNNSGMVTATATIVLVIITGFYAWNTHLQGETMRASRTIK